MTMMHYTRTARNKAREYSSTIFYTRPNWRRLHVSRALSLGVGCFGVYTMATNRRITNDELIGKRFGRWTVIKCIDRVNYEFRWLCKCDCGGEKIVKTAKLLRGRSKSCGCLRKENTRQLHTKHGCSKTREFKIWLGIKARCNNPNVASFERYGGRGIKLCDRWNEFSNFLSDMGICPPQHSIERVDNDKGYSPDNCVWADRTAQNNNTRRNKFITHDGETLTVSQWARKLGMPTLDFRHRVSTGWSVAEIIETPVRGPRKPVTIGAHTHSITEWAQIFGISYGAMQHRLDRKWSEERLMKCLHNAEQLTLL